MNASTISWTESTWNPVSGCTEVSPGCDNCYARTIAERFAPKPGTDPKKSPYPNGFQVTLRPHVLEQPLKWKEPRKIFVNSMSDLFHRDIPRDYVGEIFNVMRRCPQHQFQVLTKRPARAGLILHGLLGDDRLPRLWLGVSVEDRRRASRIDELRAIPPYMGIRFVSFEPLLEDVTEDPNFDLLGVDWAIIGGESGAKARPFDPVWARNLIHVCRRDGCAPYVKQMGTVWARGASPRPTIVKNGVEQFDSKGENPKFWFPITLRIQEYPRVAV